MKRPRYRLRMTDEDVKALRERYIESADVAGQWREALMMCETLGLSRLAWLVRKITRFAERIADDDRAEMRRTYNMAASDEVIRQYIRDHLAVATKYVADMEQRANNLRQAMFDMRRTVQFRWTYRATYLGYFALVVWRCAARPIAIRVVRHYHRLAEKEL